MPPRLTESERQQQMDGLIATSGTEGGNLRSGF